MPTFRGQDTTQLFISLVYRIFCYQDGIPVECILEQNTERTVRVNFHGELTPSKQVRFDVCGVDQPATIDVTDANYKIYIGVIKSSGAYDQLTIAEKALASGARKGLVATGFASKHLTVRNPTTLTVNVTVPASVLTDEISGEVGLPQWVARRSWGEYKVKFANGDKATESLVKNSGMDMDMDNKVRSKDSARRRIF